MFENIEPIRFDEFVKANNIDLESLSLDKLNALLNYKYELEDREKNYGICYYRPQPYQQKFHNSFKKVRLALGGNQTGKTECGCAEDIRIALGLDNTIEKMKCRPPYKLRVCANDLDKGIQEVIVSKYQKLIPPETLKGRPAKYSGGQWKKIYFKNGSTIELMSYEQETDLYEGWTGHGCHFDEPPPQDKYTATIRGLMRFDGKVWITATPLNEPWIYDEIYLKGLHGDKDTDVFEFSLFDNIYLTDKAREFFISQIPEEEREARVYGKFKHLSGLVYKEFCAKHIMKSFDIPENWVRICAMDYHSQKDCVVVWVAIDEKDRAFVYDELVTGGTVKEIAEKIVAKEQETGGPAEYRFIDSISATPDRISGRNAQREFGAEGLRLKWNLVFRSSTKNFVVGKNAVCEYLHINANGEPNMYFFGDKCKQLISCMGKYVWSEPNRQTAIKERPKKVYDDLPDALRYALVLKIKYKHGKAFRAIEQDNYVYNSGSVTGYGLGQ